MIRRLLPVAICMIGLPATAQTCENIPLSPDNCVRVLACIGDGGLYVDGGAYGWDAGPLSVERSDGVACTGSWDSNGPFGTGFAEMICDDGLSANVIYYTQDNETGTVIGHGEDSNGRAIQAWSGTNILEFLSEDGTPEAARLPCSPDTLLIG